MGKPHGNSLRDTLEIGHQPALQKPGGTRTPEEGRTHRMHAAPPWHPQCDPADQDVMAKRLDDVVALVKTHPDKGPGGSKAEPKPSTAMVRSTGP